MAKKIYRFFIKVAIAACIFFTGSAIKIPNPVSCILATLGLTAVLTAGYYLGRKSSYDEENNFYPEEDVPQERRR